MLMKTTDLYIKVRNETETTSYKSTLWLAVQLKGARSRHEIQTKFKLFQTLISSFRPICSKTIDIHKTMYHINRESNWNVARMNCDVL